MKRWCFVGLLCVAWLAMSACTTTYYASQKQRRRVRVWTNKAGCRFKRVIYPCHSIRGNLKVQTVVCPNGRRWKRRWVHPDNRCTPRRRDHRELIP